MRKRLTGRQIREYMCVVVAAVVVVGGGGGVYSVCVCEGVDSDLWEGVCC